MKSLVLDVIGLIFGYLAAAGIGVVLYKDHGAGIATAVSFVIWMLTDIRFSLARIQAQGGEA